VSYTLRTIPLGLRFLYQKGSEIHVGYVQERSPSGDWVWVWRESGDSAWYFCGCMSYWGIRRDDNLPCIDLLEVLDDEDEDYEDRREVEYQEKQEHLKDIKSILEEQSPSKIQKELLRGIDFHQKALKFAKKYREDTTDTILYFPTQGVMQPNIFQVVDNLSYFSTDEIHLLISSENYVERTSCGEPIITREEDGTLTSIIDVAASQLSLLISGEWELPDGWDIKKYKILYKKNVE